MPVSIRLYISMEMDRPIDPEKHYLSPGGYTIKTKDNKETMFDFDDYSDEIDKYNPAIIHWDGKSYTSDDCPDPDIFMSEVLPALKSLEDCFVYTGEPGEDPEINPEKLISFIIRAEGQGINGLDIKGSRYVDVKKYPSEIIFSLWPETIDKFNAKIRKELRKGE